MTHKQRIPNIIHFCYGLCENPPFDILEYLAIKSAIDLNQPDAVLFHYKYLPSGSWWDSIRPFLTLVPVEPPTEIFGNRVWHHAHQADVIRLNALIEHGGIYLDMDTLCVRPFDDLRTHRCVMGRQSANRGLCNAVILAEPRSMFLKAWLDRYRDFRPDEWDEHSVQLPLALAQTEQLADEIHILDVDRFFFPDWENMEALFESQDHTHFENSYCIHYWANITRKRWLNGTTLASIHAHDTNFSIMARRHLLMSNHRQLSETNPGKENPKITTPSDAQGIVENALNEQNSSPAFADQLADQFADLPDGWFSAGKCRILYCLARDLPGPMMEIGSFVGRSTACICLGIKDSGRDKPFFSTDLHFASQQSFLAHYAPIHGARTQVPKKQAHYIENGGTRYHLEKNLRDRGLLDLVKPLTGDFQQVMPISDLANGEGYGLIFCDATHDQAEIELNIPRLAKYLRPGSVLVCDDIRNIALANRIADIISFRKVRRFKNLLIGVVA